MPAIWTIGYERLLPAELVAELQAAGVDPAVCHRRVLTELLRARGPGLTVIDL